MGCIRVTVECFAVFFAQTNHSHTILPARIAMPATNPHLRSRAVAVRVHIVSLVSFPSFPFITCRGRRKFLNIRAGAFVCYFAILNI